MMHVHLKAYAEWLDEENYRAGFREDLSRIANRSFHDDDGLDPAWMQIVWARLFRMKLEAAGVALSPGQSVLDVCCGQGFLGSFCEERGTRVTFMDLSARQLASLKERRARAGKAPLACNADLLKLPFGEATFDLVVGNSFLHHLPDVPAALREINRVLKPGGTFVSFHEPSVRANWWETFPLSLVKDTTYRSGFTDLWQFREDELLRLLERSGFAGAHARGSGILGAALCNWFLILAAKLGVKSRFVLYPVYSLRNTMSKLELSSAKRSRADGFPSLLIWASKC